MGFAIACHSLRNFEGIDAVKAAVIGHDYLLIRFEAADYFHLFGISPFRFDTPAGGRLTVRGQDKNPIAAGELKERTGRNQRSRLILAQGQSPLNRFTW